MIASCYTSKAPTAHLRSAKADGAASVTEKLEEVEERLGEGKEADPEANHKASRAIADRPHKEGVNDL